METIASLVVGKPLNILIVAALFFVAYVAQRRTGSGSDGYPRSFLMAATVWAVYAAWEWSVVTLTPEANIRADLMVIWPHRESWSGRS